MDEQVVTAGGILAVTGLVLYALGPLGPLGLFLLGGVLLTVGLVSSSDDDFEPAENCPDCGAVVDGESCDYCGRSLSE